MLDRIFTKLGQKQVWVDGYKTYGFKNSSGVIWGHRGQKDDFTKNATPPTDYMVWSGDLSIMQRLDPLYKSYGSKNSSGVIWGHRGQKCEFLLFKRLN